jgi:serine phosphatase RsbU (regulator of sigma subunit)
MKTVNDVTILFVDDEADLLNSLRRFLRREPYHTLFANSASTAMEILATQPVDIVVSDLRMPDMDGLTLLREIKKDYPEIIRLILSASRDIGQTIDAINFGEVYRFISKPLDPEPFKRIILEVIDYHLLLSNRQEMMAEIERRLLHASPPQGLAGAEIAALMISAGHLGGDFAEYFVYDDRHLDILVGDVMGKGIQSALVAASIKHQFAKSLAEYDCGITPKMSCPHNLAYDITKISQVVSGVQAMCIESLLELEIFATLNFARFDLVAGQMSLVDCGHLPVLHFQAKTGACALLKGENLPLGIVKEQTYQVTTADLEPEDVLLFYTDGVTETQSTSGEMYGTQRLAEQVQACHHLPLEALTDAIRAEVATFSGRDQFDDDLTCVAVRIEATK